ncbi:MAG TPA: hypothetical protein VHB20_07485 [Verrucomicrobiae bacterium]|nr:hypothetical protein [Verrucomicrobiae bacterium]
MIGGPRGGGAINALCTGCLTEFCHGIFSFIIAEPCDEIRQMEFYGRRCRVCGCAETSPCLAPGPCSWAGWDICSVCWEVAVLDAVFTPLSRHA